MARLSFIFRTDVHVADKSPASWKGDYPAEIWSNLEQIGELARKHKAAAVLDGGDYFHVKAASRNPHSLVVRSAEIHTAYPCPVFSIEGNHDIAANNLSTVDRQPIGVLFAAKVFQHLREEVFEVDGLRVRVVGCPYDFRRSLDDLRAIKKQPGDDRLIAVVHQLAAKNPPDHVEDFFGEPVFRYQDLVSEDGPDVWCFPPGTPILDALYRPVPIELVHGSMAVADRAGSTIVEAVHPIRQVAEDLVLLDVEGMPSLIPGVTAEHPYWVAKGLQCALPSRASRRCHPDKPQTSHPCSRCDKAPQVEATWVEAGQVEAGDYVAFPVPAIPVGDVSTPGLARLLGYYVAEGHIIKNRAGEPVAGVGFSFHADETALQEDVRALVRDYFGLETHTHPTTGNCVQVCSYGPEIAAFFAEHGGRYADRKALSSWIWCRPARDRLEFLTGWLLGDGHARQNRVEVMGATASQTLAFQVFFLALSLRLRPYFTVRRLQPHQNHPCHVISFYGEDGDMLSQRMGIRPPSRNKTKVAGFFADGLYYARVRKVSRRAYSGPVHNFRTTTGMYVAGGVLVHNCFGHWHRDQGIEIIDGVHFVNQGSVSRGALVRENLERVPKVALILVDGPDLNVTPIPLKVAPSNEVFDLEKKERRDQEGSVIDQFVRSLEENLKETTSEIDVQESVNRLDFAPEVREMALAYLEAARLEGK